MVERPVSSALEGNIPARAQAHETIVRDQRTAPLKQDVADIGFDTVRRGKVPARGQGQRPAQVGADACAGLEGNVIASLQREQVVAAGQACALDQVPGGAA